MKNTLLRPLAVGLVCFPVAANAQIETLTYQSGVLTGFEQQTEPPIPPALPTTQNLTASFDISLQLARPLGDGLSNAPVTPVSWSADCYGSIFCAEVQSNAPTGDANETASFHFSTNAYGGITGWNFVESTTIGPGDVYIELTSSGPLSQDTFSLNTKCCPLITDEATGTNGTWQTVTATPEIGTSSVPEPSTMSLLLAGFAGLAVIGRRRWSLNR
jgi:hypothetical protein